MFTFDDCKSGNRCFLEGSVEIDQNFVNNTLMSALNGRNEINISVASTGIAITLLAEGRTYHSQFKFPTPLKENSTSNIRPNSEVAKLLKKASITN
jgi:ATP-dependent DNA helicase PIF1